MRTMIDAISHLNLNIKVATLIFKPKNNKTDRVSSHTIIA